LTEQRLHGLCDLARDWRAAKEKPRQVTLPGLVALLVSRD
jgi:hypothetical protein